MQTFTPYFNTLGRVLISAIFLPSGITKVSAYDATQAYVSAMGVPGNGPGVLAFDNRNAS